MSDGYRVEVSKNNRAGCQDGYCKKEKSKILKGEIRFGAWVSGSSVDGRDFSGYKWRHWGCVSGKTMENIRTKLQQYGDGINFNWDYLDGFEDMPPDYQEKIKSAITEGKIADEDWNGDPAYNVLGKIGLRPRASAKKNREDEEKDHESANVETPSKPPSKKRGRATRDDADVDVEEEHEAKPTKKRATNVKKEEKGHEQEAKPAKRRATKAKKAKEDDDLESKPTRKNGAEQEKSDDEISTGDKAIEAKPKPKPTRKSRAKKGTKNEQDTGSIGEGNGTDAKMKPAQRGRARAVKKEDSDDPNGFVEADANIADKPGRRGRGKRAISQKDEVPEDTVDATKRAIDEPNADAMTSIQGPASPQHDGFSIQN